MKSISSQKSALKRRKKIMIITVVGLLLLAAGAATYVLIQQHNLEQQKILQPSQSAKDDVINSDKDSASPGAGLPDNSTGTTTDQVPISADLAVSITSATQSEGLVKAAAQTSGSGTCVFLYQPADGGKPVTRQVEVSSNNCSVEISQNEFAYLGQWKLTVTYYLDNSKVEASKDVTIN